MLSGPKGNDNKLTTANWRQQMLLWTRTWRWGMQYILYKLPVERIRVSSPFKPWYSITFAMNITKIISGAISYWRSKHPVIFWHRSLSEAANRTQSHRLCWLCMLLLSKLDSQYSHTLGCDNQFSLSILSFLSFSYIDCKFSILIFSASIFSKIQRIHNNKHSLSISHYICLNKL